MNDALFPVIPRFPRSILHIWIGWAACVLAGCTSSAGGGDAIGQDTTQDTQLSDSAEDVGDLDVLPSPWTLFSLSQGGFCAPGSDCFSTWELSNNGALSTKKGGVNANAQLSTTDLTTIKATLDQMTFLGKMKDGFSCGQPPTDISYSFSYALSGAKYDQDVTGCQLSGGQDGPLVQGIVALLKAY